jgi:hypothetical protein
MPVDVQASRRGPTRRAGSGLGRLVLHNRCAVGGGQPPGLQGADDRPDDFTDKLTHPTEHHNRGRRAAGEHRGKQGVQGRPLARPGRPGAASENCRRRHASRPGERRLPIESRLRDGRIPQRRPQQEQRQSVEDQATTSAPTIGSRSDHGGACGTGPRPVTSARETAPRTMRRCNRARSSVISTAARRTAAGWSRHRPRTGSLPPPPPRSRSAAGGMAHLRLHCVTRAGRRRGDAGLRDIRCQTHGLRVTRHRARRRRCPGSPGLRSAGAAAAGSPAPPPCAGQVSPRERTIRSANSASVKISIPLMNSKTAFVVMPKL